MLLYLLGSQRRDLDLIVDKVGTNRPFMVRVKHVDDLAKI